LRIELHFTRIDGNYLIYCIYQNNSIELFASGDEILARFLYRSDDGNNQIIGAVRSRQAPRVPPVVAPYRLRACRNLHAEFPPEFSRLECANLDAMECSQRRAAISSARPFENVFGTSCLLGIEN
jgi:hypothetical protein